MKELDPLRAALAASTERPWREVPQERTAGWGACIKSVPVQRIVAKMGFRDGKKPEREANRRAIVLSVNLAPYLLRVAECAEALLDGDVHDIKGVVKVVALGDALTALRTAGAPR